MDKLFGLIGFPLSHSWSASYFTDKFRTENIKGFQYMLFPLKDIAEFEKLIASEPDLMGLNVTIPYKEQVIPYLDQLDESAKEIGAVNTIKFIRTEDKIFSKGFNTDVTGFEKSLDYYKVEVPEKALILGTGGASKSVDQVLRKLGCKTTFVTRKRKSDNQITYEELNKIDIRHFELVVNTTPLGMYPKIEEFPEFPYYSLTKSHTLYDLVYNPTETMFLKKGKAKGCKIVGGLYMLQQQAEAAWKIWTTESIY